MPRRRVYTEGTRVNVWIPKQYRKTWDSIENRSQFIQLCLDDCIGIMTWAILKKSDPEKYTRPIDKNPPPNLTDDFNKEFPLDPMTKKRIQRKKTNTWKDTSPGLRSVL